MPFGALEKAKRQGGMGKWLASPIGPAGLLYGLCCGWWREMLPFVCVLEDGDCNEVS